MGLGGGYSEGSGETMSEMTGLERLRALGREQEERSWSTVGKVRGRLMGEIARQIEDERLRERLAVERVASEMELHCLGVEGMEDSPVARWARELREVLDAGRDPADERDAIAWVREHGGIAYVKDAWNVRRNLDRQLEKAQAKVERQQRHIESIQSKLSERREHIENIANDVRNQCLAFGVNVSECDDEFDMLHDLNEALSKRLMPVGMEWPRFQDGEPVPLGGEVTVTVHDEDGDFDRTLAIRSIKYKESGVLLEGTKNEMVVLSYGERVRRPAPEVLDADGTEIRVGDTVYDKDTGDRFEIMGLSGDGFAVCWDVDKCEADIEIGARQLTHERPDSWERITEDIASPYCADYCVKYGVDHSSMSFEYAKACDLVRRAKALAERERDE